MIVTLIWLTVFSDSWQVVLLVFLLKQAYHQGYILNFRVEAVIENGRQLVQGTWEQGVCAYIYRYQI
jgi:hypothetical protein